MKILSKLFPSSAILECLGKKLNLQSYLDILIFAYLINHGLFN